MVNKSVKLLFFDKIQTTVIEIEYFFTIWGAFEYRFNLNVFECRFATPGVTVILLELQIFGRQK